MNNMKLLLLGLSLLLAVVYADLSLTSTALVNERQYYESTVNHATQAVLKQLNKNNEIAKSSRISKVDIDDTKVAESILYSVNLQLDVGNTRGLNYGLQFVQPLAPWRSVRQPSALLKGSHRYQPSSLTLHGSPSYMPPEISLNLTGPLELYLPHASTELVVKTPRYVDVGFVDRIVVREGVNITLSGSVEIRLRDSLSISPSLSDNNDLLLIDTQDKPKLNVYGHHIEIRNVEGEQIKAHKKYSSVLEISSSSSDPVFSSGRLPFALPLNDSRVQTIQAMLQQLAENDPNLPSVHQIATGSSAEAVVSFMIPMQVEDVERGRATTYDVVVVQGSNHKEARVISIEKQKAGTQVTFSQEVLNNGSLPDAMERLNGYLLSKMI